MLTALHEGGPTHRAGNAKQAIPETGKVYPNARSSIRARRKTPRRAKDSR
jgi:hypothetical protein